jgi:hypothetical protein
MLGFEIAEVMPKELESETDEGEDVAERKRERRKRWYDTNITSYNTFKHMLSQKYQRDTHMMWRDVHTLFTLKQGDLSADEYITLMQEKGEEAGATTDQIQHAILAGLNKSLLDNLVHHEIDSIESIRRWSQLFEKCGSKQDTSLTDTVNKLSRIVEQLQVRTTTPVTPPEPPQGGDKRKRKPAPAVRFASAARYDDVSDDDVSEPDEAQPMPRRTAQYAPQRARSAERSRYDAYARSRPTSPPSSQTRYRPDQGRANWSRPEPRFPTQRQGGTVYSSQYQNNSNGFDRRQNYVNLCRACCLPHRESDRCIALGKRCHECNGMDHFQRAHRFDPRDSGPKRQQ